MDNIQEFAEKYFSEFAGKAVPLDLLMAWLSEHHYHTEDGKPIVPSMELHRWAKENAVSRVVDHEMRDGMEVWIFSEYGWHKQGPACEAFLNQSQARIQHNVSPYEGMAPPPSFDE